MDEIGLRCSVLKKEGRDGWIGSCDVSRVEIASVPAPSSI